MDVHRNQVHNTHQPQHTLRCRHTPACTVDWRKTTGPGIVPSMQWGREAVSQLDLVQESVSKATWRTLEETERSA